MTAAPSLISLAALLFSVRSPLPRFIDPVGAERAEKIVFIEIRAIEPIATLASALPRSPGSSRRRRSRRPDGGKYGIVTK